MYKINKYKTNRMYREIYETNRMHKQIEYEKYCKNHSRKMDRI